MIYVLAIALFLICSLTFLPVSKNEYWLIRIWDYPRKQFLLILTVLLILFFVGYRELDVLFFSVLFFGGLAEIMLISLVFPYTKFAKLESANAPSQQPDIRVLISNVLMENENYSSLILLLKEKDADIVMLVETDEKWQNALAELDVIYPFGMHHVLSNTYGIMIYSKIKVKNHEFRYIVKNSIPSFHALMELENGKTFYFWGLHPEPPFPTISTTSAYRDAEILIVAKEIKDTPIPTIVAGDLNDVAWSYTTKLFQKESNLLDPRKGRGFFSSFHAKYFWARWPLDHVFVSKHFEIVKMERLRSIHSDHFPIYIELNLPDTHSNLENDEPNAEERGVIKEKLEQVDVKR